MLRIYRRCLPRCQGFDSHHLYLLCVTSFLVVDSFFACKYYVQTPGRRRHCLSERSAHVERAAVASLQTLLQTLTLTIRGASRCYSIWLRAQRAQTNVAKRKNSCLPTAIYCSWLRNALDLLLFTSEAPRSLCLCFPAALLKPCPDAVAPGGTAGYGVIVLFRVFFEVNGVTKTTLPLRTRAPLQQRRGVCGIRPSKHHCGFCLSIIALFRLGPDCILLQPLQEQLQACTIGAIIAASLKAESEWGNLLPTFFSRAVRCTQHCH